MQPLDKEGGWWVYELYKDILLDKNTKKIDPIKGANLNVLRFYGVLNSKPMRMRPRLSGGYLL